MKKLSLFSKIPKFAYIVSLAFLILIISISVPTFSKYKNRINLYNMLESAEVWDGGVANSFASGSGTVHDPYLISNAKEFAYFLDRLNNTNFSNTYFKLSNDIILNKGTFGYNDGNVSYKLNDVNFYLKHYTMDLYDNADLFGQSISNINGFSKVNNFNGYFDGDYHTIYGLYLTNNTKNVSLFNTLSGTFKNIYFENTMVYGGSNTSLVASNLSSATVSDIYMSGNVVSTDSARTDLSTIKLNDISIEKSEEVYSSLINVSQFYYGNINKIVLKGSYSSTDSNQHIFIDGKDISPGIFEIQLKSSNIENISISIQDNISSNILLSNLVYEVYYNYSVASSLSGVAVNSNVRNVVNKMNVYGTNSSGLIGVMTNSNLENAYNISNINGTDSASALVNVIRDSQNIKIDKVYNTGNVSANETNIIGKVFNNNIVELYNVINAVDVNYTISDVNGNINFNNFLDIASTRIKNGALSKEITVVTVDQLKTKDFLLQKGFYEFLDSQDLSINYNNVWVYEYGYLPILYIDELNNPLAELCVDKYSWNNYAYELNELKFSKNIAFAINSISEFNSAKRIYYYVHNGTNSLSKADLSNVNSWTKYKDVVYLSESGIYIIYVKIEDNYGNVSYINSERLLLDLSGPNISLKLNDKEWNTFNETLGTISFFDAIVLNMSSTDSMTKVVENSYYISNEILNLEQVKAINEWQPYTDNISINDVGNYVVYVKSIDEVGNITYINSDLLVYGGYDLKLKVDINSNNYKDIVNITSKSEVAYEFKYNNNIAYVNGYKTLYISDVLLPINTKIYLVDNELRNLYEYKVTDNNYGFDDNGYASYYFSEFYCISCETKTKFDEEEFLSSDKKDFTLILDLKDTEVIDNFSINGYVETRNSSDNVIVSTLVNTKKSINVYNEELGQLSIFSNSILNTIIYDSNSEYLVNLDVIYNKDSMVEIYDSTLSNELVGLNIKLVSSDGKIVNCKYLRNMEFIVGGKNYFADSDGIVRIPLGKYESAINKDLIIRTYENDLPLLEGNYAIVISPYFAFDGRYFTDEYNNSISIPVVSSYIPISNYKFDVDMTSEKILNKSNGLVDMQFNFEYSYELSDPKILISFYKKESFVAADQTYSLIDLKEFTDKKLNNFGSKLYYVDNCPFILPLNLTLLEKNGYEFRFDLYDGSTYLATVKRKILVR